jgi:hypothetical protein
MKTDIFTDRMWYGFKMPGSPFVMAGFPVEKVREILAQNKEGIIPEVELNMAEEPKPAIKGPDYENVVGQDELTRFDTKGKSGKKRSKGKSGRDRDRKPRAEGAEVPREARTPRPERAPRPERRPRPEGDKPREARAPRPEGRPVEGTPRPAGGEQGGDAAKRRRNRGRGRGRGDRPAGEGAPKPPAE